MVVKVKTAGEEEVYSEKEGERRRDNTSQVDGPINAQQVKQVIDNRFQNNTVFQSCFSSRSIDWRC